MLFLQGTRDALAELGELEPVCTALGERATLKLFADADHSFHVPARTGRRMRRSLPKCWMRSPSGPCASSADNASEKSARREGRRARESKPQRGRGGLEREADGGEIGLARVCNSVRAPRGGSVTSARSRWRGGTIEGASKFFAARPRPLRRRLMRRSCARLTRMAVGSRHTGSEKASRTSPRVSPISASIRSSRRAKRHGVAAVFQELEDLAHASHDDPRNGIDQPGEVRGNWVSA